MRDGPTDEELLTAFAETGDEAAFRDLASRYSGLVFHVAMRAMGDRGLAEDVVQRVFLSLAKKAGKLAESQVSLPAWLHRAAILEAKAARRAEMRHQRKKEAMMHAPDVPPSPADSQWSDALPHLDAAIDRLPDADRTVLLLHYVNGLTFPQIAAKIGKSAAAVQKQSRRALEVLQRSLTRRGVTLSIGVLTACLTTEMAKAAPVFAIPAPAVLAQFAKSKASLFVMKKSSAIAIASTVLLCGVPLARQQVRIHELESRLAVNSIVDRSESGAGRKTRSGAVVKNFSQIERLARDLSGRGSDMPRYLTATEYLSGRDDDTVVALIRETISSSMSRKDREIVFGHLLDVLSERNVESALSTLTEVVPMKTILTSQRAKNMLTNGLGTLANTDGPRALAWFNAHLESFRSIQQEPIFANDRLEDKLRLALAKGLIFSDAGQAIEVLLPTPREQVVFEFEMMAMNNEPRLREDASGYIRLVRELFPAKRADEAVAGIVGGSFNGFPSVDELLERYPSTPEETNAILIQAATQCFSQASYQPGEMEQAIPGCRKWLEARSTADVDQRIGVALGKTVLGWPNSGEPIYQAMLKSEKLGLGEDAIIGLLEAAGSKLGMERSTKLAEQISDLDLAYALLEQIKEGGDR